MNDIAEKQSIVADVSYGLRNQEEFDAYISFLSSTVKGVLADCPYHDPDGILDMDYSYYKTITDFLNSRVIPGSSVRLKFIPPAVRDDRNRDESADEYKIVVKKDDKLWLRLTTDLFGFSAICLDGSNLHAWDSRYPYAKYLKESNLPLETKTYNVAAWVKKTRMLGGSFIWPVSKWDESKGCWDRGRKSHYNFRRGVSSYIDDRVDLTLLEVKSFYECYRSGERPPTREDFKKKYEEKMILLNYCDSDLIIDWLDIFKSFDGFIDFFCFKNSFIEGKEPKLFADKMRIKDLEVCKIVEMLDGVSEGIKKRTEDMTSILCGKDC